MSESEHRNASTQLDAIRDWDALCDAFEQQLCQGEAPTLARYLEQVPPGERAKMIPELLAMTRHHLSESAMRGQLKDYLEQFPERSHTIIDILREETLSAAATSFQLDPSSGHLSPGLRPGERFGKFEIKEEIARGGMGVIFKARQQDLDRIVALKVIISGQLASEEEIKRFEREARSVAALEHPNIVSIYEVDQIGQHHYFTMKFIDGQDLNNWNQQAPRSVPEKIRVLSELCDGIDYAHRQEIIHRDLKPGNILVNREGRVQIIDFGLAKKLSGLRTAITGEQLIGTPLYMSPEQLLGDASSAGPRSDIYAIGSVMYELLTDRKPFTADTLFDLMQKVESTEPQAPTEHVADLPSAVDEICLRCLAKDPQKRYATAGEVANALRAIGVVSPHSAARVFEGGHVQRQPSGRSQGAAVQREWMKVGVLIAGLFVLVVGGLSWFLWPAAPDQEQALPMSPERDRPGVPLFAGDAHSSAEGFDHEVGSAEMPERLGLPEPAYSSPLTAQGMAAVDGVEQDGQPLFLLLELKLSTSSFEFYKGDEGLTYPSETEARGNPAGITPELEQFIRGRFQVPCRWEVTDSRGTRLAGNAKDFVWNKNEGMFGPESWDAAERGVHVWAIWPLAEMETIGESPLSISVSLTGDTEFGSRLLGGQLMVYREDPLANAVTEKP